jgi:L-glyceraldehyde 3-phosphate reductase
MINRWVEKDGLKDTLAELGVGSIAFVPLAQGLLTSKYLGGVPEGSRALQGKSLDPDLLSPDLIERLRALDAMAKGRGQTLAQMALAWVLRDGGITSALIGASRPSQVEDCAGAIRNLGFTTEELAEIDRLAPDEEAVNLWKKSSSDMVA